MRLYYVVRPYRWSLLFEGFEISVLHFVQSPSDSTGGGGGGQTERDREEKRWINRLMSVVPRGLHLMD